MNRVVPGSDVRQPLSSGHATRRQRRPGLRASSVYRSRIRSAPATSSIRASNDAVRSCGVQPVSTTVAGAAAAAAVGMARSASAMTRPVRSMGLP
jgi:hypothetical protein